MTLVEWLEDFRAIAPEFTWKIKVGFNYSLLGGLAHTEPIKGTHKNGLGFCGCPLTCYLYVKQKKILPDCCFRQVGEKIGLSENECDIIANAADGYNYMPSLRTTLLEITQLAEEKSVIQRATDDIMSCTLVDS